MKTKICTKCHKRKKLLLFFKDKYKKDGYDSQCKKCISKVKIFSQNKRCPICDKLISNKASKCRSHAQEKGKKNSHYKHGFYINNKCSKQHNYRNNNHCINCDKKITDKAKRCKKCEIKRIKITKEQKIKNRNKYEKLKKRNNILYKIVCNLRSTVSKTIARNKRSASTMKLVGCIIPKLKQHLEKQFKIGMSWENYGKWHVDHIRPCCSFDLSKPEEQKKCFNYTNLQPLWAEENLRKSDKWLKY